MCSLFLKRQLDKRPILCLEALKTSVSGVVHQSTHSAVGCLFLFFTCLKSTYGCYPTKWQLDKRIILVFFDLTWFDFWLDLICDRVYFPTQMWTYLVLVIWTHWVEMDPWFCAIFGVQIENLAVGFPPLFLCVIFSVKL